MVVKTRHLRAANIRGVGRSRLALRTPPRQQQKSLAKGRRILVRVKLLDNPQLVV
ncbi:MAG: hypothetical protein K6U09_11025 [Acidobacteriia bacterium]|nr:hypothetical protein [Terriglobia bacterium]